MDGRNGVWRENFNDKKERKCLEGGPRELSGGGRGENLRSKVRAQREGRVHAITPPVARAAMPCNATAIGKRQSHKPHDHATDVTQ